MLQQQVKQALDSTTIAAADFAAGAVVQLAATPTGAALTGSALRNSAGTTVADNGYAFGRPTAGYRTPFAVISEDLPVNERNILNLLSDTANPTARDGGQVPLVIAGYTRALVKASVTKGVTMLTPVDGQSYLSELLANGPLYSLVAASASPGTSTAEDTVATYTLPANVLRAGDEINFSGFGTVGANATPNLRVKVKIGSTVVLDSTSIATANGDFFAFRGNIKIRTIGASGTLVGGGLIAVGTAAEATLCVEKAGPSVTTSTAVDTTATQAITVTVTYGTSHGSNIATLQDFNLSKSSSVTATQLGPTSQPFAIAMETVDNSAAAALTQILIVQPAF
jgi:hypothetical protein